MSSVKGLLARKKSEKIASAIEASTLTPEQKTAGGLFLNRLKGGIKPKSAVVKTQPTKSEIAPLASTPTATPVEGENETEEGLDSKMAEELPPEPEEPLEDLPDVEGLLKEGQIPHDAGDFEPFEKIAASESIYQSRRPHPLDLFKSLSVDFGGMGWAEWTPEATWAAIKEKTGAAPNALVRNMIGALKSLVESESFWNEHHSFLWIAQALNGDIPDFSDLPELTPEQIVFAIHVADQIRDGSPIKMPDKSELPGMQYGDQVMATVAVIFHIAGLLFVPPPVPAEANVQIRKLQDPAAQAMSRQVETAWSKLVKRVEGGEALKAADFDPDDPLDLQLARMTSIREYMSNPHAE